MNLQILVHAISVCLLRKRRDRCPWWTAGGEGRMATLTSALSAPCLAAAPPCAP